MLLISHGDNDHAGGAKAVIGAFDIQRLLASDDKSGQLPLPAQFCRAGQTWRWDGVNFEILWPQVAAASPGIMPHAWSRFPLNLVAYY